MYRWLAEEGWVTILAILNVALAFFTAWRQRNHELRIHSVEIRIQGLLERLTAAYQKIDTVDRRITGQFSGDGEADTKLRKAVKKVKNPDEYDDK